MKRHQYKLKRNLRTFTKKKKLANHVLNYIKKNVCFPLAVRQNSMLFLSDAEFFIPYSRVHTFCLVTGRIRYTMNNTYMSRIVFNEGIRNGIIPGFRNSS